MSAPNRPKGPPVRTGKSSRCRVADDRAAGPSKVVWQAGILPTPRASHRAGEGRSSCPSNPRHLTGAVRVAGANRMWRHRHRRCRRCFAILTCRDFSRSARRDTSPGLYMLKADAGGPSGWSASAQRPMADIQDCVVPAETCRPFRSVFSRSDRGLRPWRNARAPSR